MVSAYLELNSKTSNTERSPITMWLSLLTSVFLLSFCTVNSQSSDNDTLEEMVNTTFGGEGLVQTYIQAMTDAHDEDDMNSIRDPNSAPRQKMKEIEPYLNKTGLSESSKNNLVNMDNKMKTHRQKETFRSYTPQVDLGSRNNGKKVDRQKTIFRSHTSLEDLISLNNEKKVNLGKRTFRASQKYRWTKGIVPYMFTDELDREHRVEVRRGQMTYERLTCIRFIPYTTTSGVDTNEQMELGHHHYLKHVDSGGCWSFVGKQRKAQDISCCLGTSCVHELGHALGFQHEQQSPDPNRNLMIRVHPNNIKDEFASQYDPSDPIQYNAPIGYDITSFMHYYSFYFTNGKGKTISKFYKETKWRTGLYYMMMETSLSYQCDKLKCEGSGRKCENDGYFTTIDYKCGCRCVPGLNPDTNCKTLLSSSTSTQKFPGGGYILPRPRQGCPRNFSPHELKESNDTQSDITDAFCLMDSEDNGDVWPAGTYCIISKNNNCPINFEKGLVKYAKMRHSFIVFCCRNQGFDFEPIFLPSRQPFVLFKYEEKCQEVRGMHVNDKVYEPGFGEITNHTGDGDPVKKVGNKTQINACLYKPAMVDCGEIITLTEKRNTVDITSDIGAELDCTWYIKTYEEGKIKLEFDNFEIEGTDDKCNDTLEIRYFRPGQTGFKFCGKTLDETFQSINSTMVLRLSTFGNTQSSFRAKASLILDKHLCYKATDRGTSYEGYVNFTRLFKPCVPWTETIHCNYNPFTILPNKYSAAFLKGNYCRNPDYNTGWMPWCYTDAEACDIGYCDVCQIGRPYDIDKHCAEKAEAGKCNETEVLSICAKTCNFKIPATPSQIAEIQCPPPPSVPSALLLDSDSVVYTPGMEVTYRCDHSKVIQKRACLTTGQWSEMGFVCDRCQFDWHLEETTDSCFKFFDHRVSISEAKKSCLAQGGELALASNKVQNSFIHKLIKKPVWLPINDIDSEDIWRLDDKQIVEWTNWDKKEPNNRGRGEDCVVMRINGKWGDVPCSSTSNYVCQMPSLLPSGCVDYSTECPVLFASKPKMCVDNYSWAQRMCPYTCGTCHLREIEQCVLPEPPENSGASTDQRSVGRGTVMTYFCHEGFVAGGGDPARGCMSDGQLSGEPLQCISSCPQGWSYFFENKQCYKLFNAGARFFRSSFLCKSENGTLAMPKTFVENRQLFDLVKASGQTIHFQWIGLSKTSENVTFSWEDGGILDKGYTNWRQGNPDLEKKDSNCVVLLLSTTEWMNIDCDKKLPYICQRPVTVCNIESPTDNTTVASDRETVDVGEQVEYSCKEGYEIVSGNFFRKCEVSGHLNGKLLTCELVETEIKEGSVQNFIENFEKSKDEEDKGEIDPHSVEKENMEDLKETIQKDGLSDEAMDDLEIEISQ